MSIKYRINNFILFKCRFITRNLKFLKIVLLLYYVYDFVPHET